MSNRIINRSGCQSFFLVLSAAGWNDPVEARRRRIQALMHILGGLEGFAYTQGLWEGDLFHKARVEARKQLLIELGLADALDGCWVFDEVGNHRETIDQVSSLGEWGWMVETADGGQSLVDFAENLIEGYVGVAGTKTYGDAAIVELAEAWLQSEWGSADA